MARIKHVFKVGNIGIRIRYRTCKMGSTVNPSPSLLILFNNLNLWQTVIPFHLLETYEVHYGDR